MKIYYRNSTKEFVCEVNLNIHGLNATYRYTGKNRFLALLNFIFNIYSPLIDIMLYSPLLVIKYSFVSSLILLLLNIFHITHLKWLYVFFPLLIVIVMFILQLVRLVNEVKKRK